MARRAFVRFRASPAFGLALAVSAIAVWPLARSVVAPSSAPLTVAGLIETLTAAPIEARAGYPAVDDHVAAGAQALLGAEPLAAEAFGALGLAAASRGDRETASRLMEIAVAGQRRDALALAWLLDRDLGRGDHAGAAARLDALLRARPETLDAVTAALAPVLADPAARTALVRRLADRPPWRTRFIDVAVRLWREPAGLRALIAGLQAGPGGLSPDELRPYLVKLLAVGEADEAYAVWLRSLPEADRASLPFLYNGDFARPLAQSPFDWRTPEVAGAKAAVTTTDGRPVLSVGFFGAKVRDKPVSHEVVLAPGDYRLTGRARVDRLRAEPGVRWRIACLARPDEALGVSDAFSGTAGWRDFAMDFSVPEEGCPVQSLGLEVAARTNGGAEAAGVISFAGLSIDPR